MENYVNYKWMTYYGIVYGRLSIYDFNGKLLHSVLVCPGLHFSRDISEWEEFFDLLVLKSEKEVAL